VSDALAVMTRVIAEHRVIREHIKLAGERVADIEAIFALRRTYADWTQSSVETLVVKQDELQQTMSFLEEGLKNHFAFEEEALPPLLGRLLMKAILLEHRDIARQIRDAKGMLISTKLEGLDQQQLLAAKSKIQQTVNNLSQAVEEHASHEETILEMMRKAVESRSDKRTG